MHRLINNTDTRCRLFKIQGFCVHNPERGEREACLVIQSGKSVTPFFGLCLRIIVNEEPFNLKKTTSSIFINLYGQMSGDSDVYATDGEKKETSLFAAVRYIDINI